MKKDDGFMKQYALMTCIICLIMIFTPLICVGVKNQGDNKNENTNETKKEETVKVLDSLSLKVTEASAKDYVLGALAAEMPASYSEEALKAQAVACYTYYRYLKENSDNSQTAIDYDISDISATHQGYLTQEEMKDKWGEKYDRNKEKLEKIVLSVLGECVMYEAEPVLALYHAISPGKTHSAKTVFGSDLPYLKSVSAVGDTLSPDFDSSNTFTKDELTRKLSLKEGNGNLIKSIEQDENGYVTEITISEKSYTGNELASILGLKSPTFSAEYKEEKYIFTVKGYGHGVGMSQYSADYMARQGSTYKEILLHFYPGTYIDKIV